MKKKVFLTIGLVLSFGFLASIARSADETRLASYNSPRGGSLAYDYNSYLAEDETAPVAPTPAEAPSAGSPSDVPLSEPEESIDEGYGDECESCSQIGCGAGCGSGGGCGCGGGKPWTLPQPCLLQALGIRVGGWVEQGITFNADHPTAPFNGPIFTNDLDREYQLNQLWMFLDRPADTGGYGVAVGGHVDLCYGTDWRYGIQTGLEDEFQDVGNTYGLVIPQFYFEVAINNLSVKVGHQAGILGYEVVPAVANPFYSHAIEYAAVPELVTGAVADYKVSDQFSFQVGVHEGWMVFEDPNNDLDFMCGVKWNSYDKRTSLAYAMSIGPQDPAGANDFFASTLVLKHQLSKKFQYVFVHNLGSANEILPGGLSAEWYGLNQYFLYTINQRWSANLRFEWFRDDDGVIIRGLGTTVPPRRGWTGSLFAGNFYELTAGLTWRPHPNVMFRPEVRWDWYDGLPGGGALVWPYNDGTSDDQFTLAADLIFTY